MDFASIIGIIIGFGSLVLGYKLDNGNLRALWLLSAFIITIGGATGSVVISYGYSEIKKMPGLFFQMFKNPKSSLPQTIDFIVSLSESARREGLLSLEKRLEEAAQEAPVDPLLKRGVLMVVDGVDLEQIREFLETDIYVHEQKAKVEISTFEALAGFAPAFGMIGTIMGLIQVLSYMESPEQMASSIAVAFITTLYGVVFANLICVPTASKLKNRLKIYLMEQETIVEGVCSIRNGQNPKMLRDKLSIYLMESEKKQNKSKKDINEEKADA